MSEAKKILLVEDDPLIAEIYTKKLDECGFDVELAADGETAFKKIQEEMFDLVILDIVLPQLTGFELLKRMEKDIESKKLTVLVLSNLGQKSDIELAKELGVVRYLIKANFTPSEVIFEIKKLLKTN